MIDKAIRFLYYSLFLIAPLAMSKLTSELFEFNKIMLIYFIASLIFLFWFIQIIKEKKAVFKKTILDIPILIFLLSQLLSFIFSFDKYTSFFGYYGRFNGGLLSIVVYVFLYYGFVNFFDIKKFNVLLKTSLWSSLVVMLWGIPGRFGFDLSCYLFVGELNNNCWINQFRPSERLFSTLGQPNWLAAYLAINFFIGIYFLIKEYKKNTNINNLIFYFFYIILNFIVILFTRSRSAYFALFFALIIFILFYLKYLSNKSISLLNNLKIFTLLIIFFIFSTFIFKTGIAKIDNITSFLTNKKIQTEIKTKDVKKESQPSGITESFDIRKIVWEGAWKLGLKYPLFGSGIETFAYSYYFVRPIEHNLTSEWDYLYNKAHNEYLNYLATTGFIGLLSYLVMISAYLYFAFISIKNTRSENNRILYMSLFCSYITILITNFFGFSTTTINVFFYIVPALSILNLIRKENEYEIREKDLILFKYSGWIISIFLLFYLSCFYIADIRYARSLTYSSAGDYQTAAIYIEKALSLHKSHVYFNSYSNDLIKLAQLAYLQKDSKLSQQLIDLSLKYANLAIKHSSKNVIYWKNKSTIEYSIYQIKSDTKYLKNATSELKKAQTLSPTDPKILYNLSVYYLAMYDETKNQKYKDLSLKSVEKSIILKPNFEDAINLQKRISNL